MDHASSLMKGKFDPMWVKNKKKTDRASFSHTQFSSLDTRADRISLAVSLFLFKDLLSQIPGVWEPETMIIKNS